MKRLLVTLWILAGVMVVPVAAQASQSGLNLNWDNIAGSQCRSGTAKQIVNVSFTLTNDYDSGFAGNAWANDSITRNLRVWQIGSGSAATFCAQTSDRGTFNTFAGTSPSGSAHVDAGVTGDLAGGYVSTFFTGTYDPTASLYSTHGDLGTFDLQCTDANNCPGAHPSPLSYFSSTAGFDLRHWGWIYHADNATGQSVWLNQDNVTAANSGDISTSAPTAGL